MPKKRKPSHPKPTPAQNPSLPVGESRKRIRDFEDVADSEDEFYLGRDRVLLDEGPEVKRRRREREREEFLEDEEEVLGFDWEEGSEDENEDEFGGEEVGLRRGTGGGSEDEMDREDESEDNEFVWGTGKDDIYGADEIETEEQALEEEAEALRLQKKQLESMTAADYGFDETEWQGGDVDKSSTRHDKSNVVTEILPQLQLRSDMTSDERLKLLKSRYPEFEPLNKELLEMQEYQQNLANDLAIQQKILSDDDLTNATTKLRAASAYLGALTMYFALLASPAADGDAEAIAMSAVQLRDHPVMDSLVKCRDLWLRAKSLPADRGPVREEVTNGSKSTVSKPKSGMELELREERARPQKKSRAQRHAEAVQAAAEARRAERMQRTEADLAGLDALVAQSAKSQTSKSKRSARDDSDGEETPLTAQEAAEKAKRKKSLRFYTSQIAQKANKRGAAGRNAGGDDDIPYRERLRDRQARLNAEAEKRGRKADDTGADLGGESDEEDARQGAALRAEADEEYYDLIASRTARKKSDKIALAEAKKQAALQGGRVVQQEQVGEDGKRGITYAIEKNKGLAPHRKNDVRNPRVKKRKKFEEKKKKLGSVKPVWKGGEGKGGYGGELTGIKKGLVKSVKL